MLTILIPTYNRPDFLTRTLCYYATVGFDGFISIGDSSNEELAAINQKTILACSRKLKIVYRHFPKTPHHPDIDGSWSFTDVAGTTYRDGGSVLADLGRHAATPYVVFCGDDDFLVPGSLEKCVRFLEKNPEYSAAHGLRMHLTIDPANHSRIIKAEYMPEHILDYDDPAQRWTNYIRHAYSTQYYVTRKEIWRKMYVDLESISDHYLGAEALPCSMTCILGKVAQLDCLSTLFQENFGYEQAFSWQTHSMFTLLQSPYWHSSIHGLISAIERGLVREGVLREQAPEIVRKELWRHIGSFLEWQYEKKYGASPSLTLSFDPSPFPTTFDMLLSPHWHGLITEVRSSAIKRIREKNDARTDAAIAEFDQSLWDSLHARIKLEYWQTYSDADHAWYNEHVLQMKTLREKYDQHLRLSNLLSSSSPYHHDFMPVYRAYEEMAGHTALCKN